MNSTTTARARLPAAATKILRQWHESHYDFPYPSTDDKVQLQQLTGLSDKQISNWFTNTRRRSRSRSSQSSRSGSEHDTSTASSLDRWRHSPPELEHVSLQDIAAAMGSVEIPVNDHRDRALRTSSDPNARDASQTSDSSHDWASDGSTSGSQSNSTVLGSVRNRRRRGRKRPNMTLLRNPTETRIFQCTFCTDAFKTKYDWSRHEASLHLPLDRWICTLSGPRYISEQQRVECCVYCDLENPSDHHLETHRSLECSKKPSVAREFYRKDHLRQHLRQVHRSERFTKAMEGWKSKITEVRSRCGFCDERFQTWPERTDHLAEHFRNGNTMKNWTGARGFEPVVATRVRHSIPPYLINMEATTILPFSAERGLSQHILPDANVANSHDFSTSVPSPFEHLVSELGKFVISQKALNITISDQALQQRARIIVYGEDDPWNQTAADNSQWLDLFKRAYDVDTQMLTELEWRDTCLPDPQDAVIDETLGLPWYWQSPECLASYRQNRAAFLASHSTSAFGSNDPSRITGSVDLFNATSACDLNQFAENASDLAPGTGDEERPMVPATSAAAQILNYAGNYSESQSSDPFNNISVGWENAEAHNG